MGMWEKEDIQPHRCRGEDGILCFGLRGCGLSLSFPGYLFNEDEQEDHPDCHIKIKYCPFCGFHYN